MQRHPEDTATEERIEQGLAALRRERDGAGNFRLSHWKWGADDDFNKHCFDDLFDSATFLRRALEEGLGLPFDQLKTTIRYGSKVKLLDYIANDRELVKLGLPLEFAGDSILNDKEAILVSVKRDPRSYLHLLQRLIALPNDFDGMDTLVADPEVIETALDTAAKRESREWGKEVRSDSYHKSAFDSIFVIASAFMRQNVPLAVKIAENHGTPIVIDKPEDLTRLSQLVAKHWSAPEKGKWATGEDERAAKSNEAASAII